KPSGNEGGRAEPSKPEGCHSFDPNTPVLLADRSTKPIKDVRVGDKVVTTTPATGAKTVEVVTALHDNHDTDLADVTVADGSGTTSVIHTTQHHEFWDATSGQWVDAAALRPGVSTVVDDQGHRETVVAVWAFVGLRDMRDLTVDITHAYFVIAGSASVLVHN